MCLLWHLIISGPYYSLLQVLTFIFMLWFFIIVAMKKIFHCTFWASKGALTSELLLFFFLLEQCHSYRVLQNKIWCSLTDVTVSYHQASFQQSGSGFWKPYLKHDVTTYDWHLCESYERSGFVYAVPVNILPHISCYILKYSACMLASLACHSGHPCAPLGISTPSLQSRCFVHLRVWQLEKHKSVL